VTYPFAVDLLRACAQVCPSNEPSDEDNVVGAPVTCFLALDLPCACAHVCLGTVAGNVPYCAGAQVTYLFALDLLHTCAVQLRVLTVIGDTADCADSPATSLYGPHLPQAYVQDVCLSTCVCHDAWKLLSVDLPHWWFWAVLFHQDTVNSLA